MVAKRYSGVMMILKNLVTLLLTSCILAGCATPSIDLVRQAQDSYNQAAQLNNQLSVFASHRVSDQDIIRQVSINNMYSSVINSVEQLKPETVEQLKASSLYGSLLTIKAISHWRLGQFVQAADTAQNALSFTQGVLPRDQVINETMPHLIRNDQAKQYIDRIQAAPSFEYQSWMSNVQTPLQLALEALPKEAEKWQKVGRLQIASYLKMTEVIAFINLRDGFLKLDPCATAGDTRASCAALETEVTSLEKGKALMDSYIQFLQQSYSGSCEFKQDPVLINIARKLGVGVAAFAGIDCQ